MTKDYRDEHARLRRRNDYLQINHPELCEAARPKPFGDPSDYSAVIGAWINSWVHSDESIEDGLVRLCLAQRDENAKISKGWSDALYAQKPMVVIRGWGK